MSTQPDWTTAPEGATHYRPSLREWYKQNNRAWLWKHGGWELIANDLGEFRWSTELVDVPRPVEWSGAGLPPVGIDIEVMHGTYGWIGARVVGHDGEAAIVRTDDGYAGVYPHEFRAIRTQEQIAAEEREKAIDDIAEIIGSLWSSEREAAEFLYKAGYRRQVSP